MQIHSPPNFGLHLLLICTLISFISCRKIEDNKPPTLSWYVFNEPSGAFRKAAENCSRQAAGRYTIALTPLPTDADQQREQLVRRLAAKDRDIDIIGMDVIWTAEFAEAGWILPWPKNTTEHANKGRLPAAVASASYKDLLWAIPFISNAQLLWYRKDRVSPPPSTWSELIEQAEAIGNPGAFQVQGQRYEGLTVFFLSLLASAGGSVIDETYGSVSLEEATTVKALSLLKRIATSSAADPGLSTAREDQNRLAFETGKPTFMVNYSFVWPSAWQNAPNIAKHIAFARWPSIDENRPSRVTIGGLNLAVGGFTRHPDFAFEAAACLAGEPNQITAAVKGGLPPTIEALYDNPQVRHKFPFADILRDTLRTAVLRPRTPVYNDISLSISRTLHPMHSINPAKDAIKLRQIIARSLKSEGLL